MARTPASAQVIAISAWNGPARYLECLWLAEASKNPLDALSKIANKRQLNISYLRYLWQLRESCPPSSLEAVLWVEPLRRLPKPDSVDQPIPDDVSEACAGIANTGRLALEAAKKKRPRRVGGAWP